MRKTIKYINKNNKMIRSDTNNRREPSDSMACRLGISPRNRIVYEFHFKKIIHSQSLCFWMDNVYNWLVVICRNLVPLPDQL